MSAAGNGSSSAVADEATKSKSPWWEVRRVGPDAPQNLAEHESALIARVAAQVSEGKFTIPQIPAVAIEAMNLLARTDSDLKQISDVVSRDQRLAADILSTANSALFAGAAKATNLSAALMRVGFRRARSVLLQACLRGAMYSGAELKRAERLWRHSCAAAAASARIAKNLGLNADDYYLCGLFHDVGKLVVLALLDQVGLRSSPKPVRPEVAELIVEDFHERVGAEVALQWGLPDDVVDVVQRHREKDASTMTAAQAIVSVADFCCRRLGAGASDTEFDDGSPVAGLLALRTLQFTPDRLAFLLEGVREDVMEMAQRNA
jgi:putative nucleotidyltransferase with HDIG domain